MTNPYQDTFHKIKNRFDRKRSPKDALVCKQGFYGGCTVLKLQKASWTNEPMDQMQNKSGVFFSVWIDEKDTGAKRVHYNIHALKLRQLKGYSITSRDFAEEFRKSFASMSDAWPNVSVKHGPLTLMQGWLDIDHNRFEGDVLRLLERFEQMSPMIDRLLMQRHVAIKQKEVEPSIRPKAPTTINEYLATVSLEKRAALQKLRKAIQAAAPEAQECICYQVPAFRLDGKFLVAFAAAKNHCSFFPGAVLETLGAELEGYETSKGTIRFQADRPLPATLVQKLVKARIARME